ncbi:cold-shock protein [Phaeodactylibacter luteus]|uniref:Cold shock domain-containing protein n=1 Tax=Phaeodactylibacter luteus TaxID=1564516 RepID=A0A5C6RJK6_9BACT|nr:cold shock domain-containing protein [Phaeodactylibacter luteus]TXB62397.1 cold shock domain-containing protein [Phaeodactylibacter luteus]
MPKGIVQFYMPEKGYGYIRVPATREEFYVHRRYLQQPIEKGMAVTFEVRSGKQGLYAAEVKAAGPPRYHEKA